MKFKKLNAKQANKILRKRLPALKRHLAAIKEAQKVPRKLLDMVIDR